VTQTVAGLAGPRRAAIAILTLDEEVAAAVLGQMTEPDLKKLAVAVDELGEVTHDLIVGVLETFDRELNDPTSRVRADGGAYVRRLAGRALGEDRARRLFAPPTPEHTPVDVLRTARANTLASLLVEEHPQIAAVILTQLAPRMAARVLDLMPTDIAADLVGRMSNLEEIPEHAVLEASESLVRALESAGGLASSDLRAEFDGLAYAASVINEMTTDSGDELLGRIADADESSAKRIREAMFTFEDLGRIDRREIAQLLRSVQSEILVVSLQTATVELREHFLGALSQRAAATLRDDLDAAAPKRIADVETAQREIVEAAMQLAAEGKITMPARGEDA
jgi:flagellar motor switch protein FliG